MPRELLHAYRQHLPAHKSGITQRWQLRPGRNPSADPQVQNNLKKGHTILIIRCKCVLCRQMHCTDTETKTTCNPPLLVFFPSIVVTLAACVSVRLTTSVLTVIRLVSQIPVFFWASLQKNRRFEAGNQDKKLLPVLT